MQIDGQTIKNRINNSTIFETSDTGLTLVSGKVIATGGGNTTSSIGDLTLTKSSGDTKLFIEADSDNDTEGDNGFLIYEVRWWCENKYVWWY